MALSTRIALVDHLSRPLALPFMASTPANADIHALKEKVLEDQNIPHFYPSDLVVWNPKGEMVHAMSRQNFNLQRATERLILNDDTVEPLDDNVKVAGLGLMSGQTLIVQLAARRSLRWSPGHHPVGDPISTVVDTEYQESFLRANSKGAFTKNDVALNGIFDADGNTLDFVMEYERLLCRRRKVASHFRELAERLLKFEPPIFDDYFGSTTESADIVRHPEFLHFIDISSVDPRRWETSRADNAKGFTESDASLLFFSAIANYYGTPTSVDDEVKMITVKGGLEPWPFPFLVQVAGQYHTHRPESDFLVLKHNLPRLAVEVKPRDPLALLLQGASIVRFVNTRLDAYKDEKNFVFVSIFISGNALVERYLLYQNEEGDPHKVYWKRRTFKLENIKDRLGFVLELYNFSSALHTDEGYTREHVMRFSDTVNQISVKNNLPTFTRRFKRNYGANDEKLEDAGYEVVPDILETDGGTWDSADKLPPSVRTVYLRDDPNETEYIAKHVSEGSNELAIHDYLRTRPSQSPHVISLIEAVPSTTREWLILPRLHSIRGQWLMNSGGVTGRGRLGWGLVKGLAYLHEHNIAHRDIKPDNLVRDDYYDLKIIDFDLAIKIRDEDTQVDVYCGTEGWTAPEVGWEDGPPPMYSPIKADRWSCGRVLLHHIMVGMIQTALDHSLSKFASELMASDPEQRPSLHEYHKLLAPPPISKTIDPPAAKKPRSDMLHVPRPVLQSL